MDKPEKQVLPYPVSLIVTKKHSKPAIEIRSNTTDKEIIKTLVYCAIYGKPVIVLPVFNDKLRSIASLAEKGVLFLDKKTGEYYFNI